MNQTEQQLLQKIASHIGTTAQQAWQILVHMHRINGTIDLLAGLLVSVLFFVVARFLYGRSKREKKDRHDDTPEIYFTFFVVSLILGVVAVIISLDTNLLEIIYPQGCALADLLHKIK